ncbi:MAG: (Fe-S)-binding protein, partial [Coriobacteriia bacterium]|nr:(Fe-S)-binding protein [Coriobacteriia bacterium]
IAADESLVQAVRGCFFCTCCKNTCFAHNDVCDLIYHARVDFQKAGLIPKEAWSSVQVDQEWDVFTAYRAVHGIYFTDLTRHVATDETPAATDCQVAFFPGCSLAAYGPELTREIFATIEELGGKTTMLDHCCGSPLKSAGFYDRAEALCDRINDEVAASGAKQIVCVCPGCANAMKTTLARNGVQDVEVTTLPAFLHDHGFQPKQPLPERPLFISKSCQDRDGSYLDATCAALGIDPSTPNVFNGCCGAGGAVSAFDPNRQACQSDGKLSFAPDGSTVVTMCPTCTYTYAFRLMESDRDLENKHYTELMFQNKLDWDQVIANLTGMWSGQYAAWLQSVLY